MPYIGNQHIVGDSVNNFKVLDDISSFTATFNGSATSIVSTANNTIRVPKHRFVHGQRVTYNNGGGSNIGGLTTGTAYYVIYDTAHTIKLATNSSNAASLTAINLNAVGGGSSHTLNVAFDGVNTKFRITHGNGNRSRIINATQVSIAINNVIQKPNDNLTFTEGYAVEVRDIIVFKTAPTVNDIFFGSLTGETRGRFDIQEHVVDNFTGDGSTKVFVLSQIAPNNQTLLVTLNGVIQHPTTDGVTRSYSVVSGESNQIEFTTAPALGVEIQVRHLGFAGATSSAVTGFYGRTGNVGLNADDHITIGDITSRNINASGIITATEADINGDLDVDGHTNLDNVSISGVTTITGTSPTINFEESDGNPNYRIIGEGGALYFQALPFGAGASGRLTLHSAGNVQVNNNLDVGAGIDVTGNATVSGDLDVTGDASFSGNVSIGGTLTYEDVKNVDSVGVGTFRDGIKVGSGVTIEPNGQATFTGIVTFGSSSTTIDGDANTVKVGTALTLGHTQGLQFHTQNLHSAGFEVNQINATGVITATSFSGSGANLTGLASREVYGFTGIGKSLSLTTTNSGADNIDNATYVAFEESFIGPSGLSFSINTSGNLIMTV